MSMSQLNIINANIRQLVKVLDEIKRGRASVDEALRLVDEIEGNVDMLVQMLAPERITDERFSATVKSLKELADKFSELRDMISSQRLTYAKKKVFEIQEFIRHIYRVLMLVRAGAPTPVIFQVSPQFLREVTVPEAVVYSNPMSAQIYNILVRRGGATVEELALELKIDDKTRDEFNRAIAQLISMGYVKPYFTPDNKMVLKPTR